MTFFRQAQRQRVPRAQIGQGFAERLVDDHWSPFQPFQNINFRGANQMPEQQRLPGFRNNKFNQLCHGDNRFKVEL